MPRKGEWPRQTWKYPLIHDFTFGFGLGIDDSVSTNQSTIVPFLMQDNAIVDYETIKTNPENADFAVVAKPNTAAGSYIPKLVVSWYAYSPSNQINRLLFKTLDISIAMLNRLDAFDKKTGNDIETILELQHETTDEQCYPLWNGDKLFEGHMIQDLPVDVPGLTTTQQPEGVNFDMEMFFDALHYYTNKEMLRKVTSKMKTYAVTDIAKAVSQRDRFANNVSSFIPSLCKYQHPYTFCGMLFHAPQAGTQYQTGAVASISAVEHLTVLGRVRFNEFNPDWNFARA